MRRFIFLVVVLCIAFLIPPPAHAQVAPLVYQPGWNLVGGPAGMDLSAAEGLFVYHDSAYAPAAGTTTAACAGYWTYFAAPQAVTLPATADTTQVCSLQPGWNLVGNAFDDPAALPPGTAAFTWDITTQSYAPAAAIPVGQAVWIWSPAGGSIPLASAAAGGITINAPPPPVKPVTLRVGQYLTLAVPLGSNGPTLVAHVQVSHLRFIIGNPVPDAGKYAYRWQAASIGEADIALDPACLAAGCAQPSFVIRVIVS